jgi:hypothetical protein
VGFDDAFPLASRAEVRIIRLRGAGDGPSSPGFCTCFPGLRRVFLSLETGCAKQARSMSPKESAPEARPRSSLMTSDEFCRRQEARAG